MIETARRGFFAMLVAPFVARFLPIPTPKPVALPDELFKTTPLGALEYRDFVGNFFHEDPLMARLRGSAVFDGGNFISTPFMSQVREPAERLTTPTCQLIHNPSERWDGDN